MGTYLTVMFLGLTGWVSTVHRPSPWMRDLLSYNGDLSYRNVPGVNRVGAYGTPTLPLDEGPIVI